MLKHNECELGKKAHDDEREIKRTDQEGKDESPYREIRFPHFDNDDSEYRHGYCESISIDFLLKK